MDDNQVKIYNDETNECEYTFNNFNYSNATYDFTNPDNWLLTDYKDNNMVINCLHGDNTTEIHVMVREYERVITVKNKMVVSDSINKKNDNGIIYQYQNKIINELYLLDYLENAIKKFTFQDRTLFVSPLDDTRIYEVFAEANELQDQYNNSIKLLRIKGSL